MHQRLCFKHLKSVWFSDDSNSEKSKPPPSKHSNSYFSEKKKNECKLMEGFLCPDGLLLREKCRNAGEGWLKSSTTLYEIPWEKLSDLAEIIQMPPGRYNAIRFSF